MPTTAPSPDPLAATLEQIRPGLAMLELPAYVIDAGQRYRFVNAAYERHFGRSAAEMVGRTVAEVFGPPPPDGRRDAVVRALAGESLTFERKARHGPNRGQWGRLHYMPIRAEGAVVGVAVLLVSIQRLKEAQEEAAARERQLALITDTIGFPVTYVDRDRIVRFANAHAAAWAGRQPREMVGRSVTELAPPRIAAQSLPLLERALAGEAVVYERDALWPGREARRIRGHMLPDRGPDGPVRGVIIVLGDIEDDYRLRESLEARTRELRFYADNIPEAVAFVGPDFHYQFVNKVFERIQGRPAAEIVGRSVTEVLGAEAALEYFDPYVERLRRGEACAYERMVGRSEAEQRWFVVRLVPYMEAPERFAGYYVIGTDIHDLKAAQSRIAEQERVLREVIDAFPTPMVYVDADQRYRYANDAFLGYVARPRERVIGFKVRDVLGPERHDALQPVIDRVLAGETVTVTRPIVFFDGRSRWMHIRYTPRKDEYGRVLGYYATTSDIHEQKAIEEELRRANSTLSAHFENTPLAVVERDPGRRVVRWTGSAAAMFGWTAEEAIGSVLEDRRFVHDDDAAAVSAMFDRLVAGPDSQATTLHRNYRKNGAVAWVEWHHSAIRGPDGALVSILSLAQDVSSRIEAEERLQHMATHDGLTDLPNRLLLVDRLSSALLRAQRSAHGVAVLFLDLDRFKEVNDRYGHGVGDRLLQEVASRVRSCLRQSDMLVRLAGDEFVIVLEGLEGEGGPDRVAQKVLDEVLRPYAIEGHELRVSASLGYAVYPEDGQDHETLLRNADAAMYLAKESGRATFRAFSRATAGAAA